MKTTTVLFICNKDEEDKIAEMQAEFDKVWTISKFKVIKSSELNSSLEEIDRTSLLLPTSVKVNFQSQKTRNGIPVGIATDMGSVSYGFLQLYSYIPKKGRRIFATIELCTQINNGAYDYSVKPHNWELGFLKNYLQTINYFLENVKTRSMFVSGYDVEEMGKLANETLYVPDFLFKYRNDIARGEIAHEELVKEIFAGYPFKYEVLSGEELSKKILSSDKLIYYISYVMSSRDVFISVFNSQTGRVIYSRYRAMVFTGMKISWINDIAGKIK